MTTLTPDQASVIASFLLPQLRQEIQVTLKVLSAVPEDRKDYSPDDKSMTAGQLAEHIVKSDIWFLEGIVNGGFGEQGRSGSQTLAELIAEYETQTAGLLDRIEALSGEELSKAHLFFTWTMPNITYLQLMQKHSVHHRGQLSAYLRPMGAKVPAIYGGSADEPFTAAASDAK